MNIRQAELEDWEKVYDLYINHNPCFIDHDLEAFKGDVKRYLTDKNNFCFCLENEEEVVGFVRYKQKKGPLNKRLYISSVIIKDTEQGKGYGKALLNYAINFAKEHEYKEITLDVMATNEKAIEFYKKMGFDIEKFLMKKRI